MNTREPFKQALAKSPKDTTLRLAYADWLEEQGHGAEAQEQRWRVQLQAHPYSPQVRTGLGEALLAQGKVRPGKLQLWWGKALRGEVSTDMIFTRRGILLPASDCWEGMTASARTYWRKTTSELFKEYRRMQVIVIGGGPTLAGLRGESFRWGWEYSGNSSIFFIRRGYGGTRYRVVPK
jgi:uncharacterized protein (TIGR02996 family)